MSKSSKKGTKTPRRKKWVVFVNGVTFECRKDEVTCYDGSCRDKFQECPVYQGCTDTNLPYKCKDGSCVKEQAECMKREKDREARWQFGTGHFSTSCNFEIKFMTDDIQWVIKFKYQLKISRDVNHDRKCL